MVDDGSDHHEYLLSQAKSHASHARSAIHVAVNLRKLQKHHTANAWKAIAQGHFDLLVDYIKRMK